MDKLIINFSYSTQPNIESIDKYKDSIFKHQYEKCIKGIDCYIENERLIQKSFDNSIEFHERNNNIFSFDGERGSGKTSCMLSVANILVDPRHREVLKSTPNVSSSNFIAIPVIDPSFFDTEHNILTLFTARLYKAFLDWEKQPQHKNSPNTERSTLIQTFIELQNNLSCMFNNRKHQDSLEYLVDLAASVEIKTNLQKLVTTYLKYIDQEDAYLLLLIDDIDIDDSHAYEMVEQLRKYFILPNVIVLVSVKIKQLARIIQTKTREDPNNKTNKKPTTSLSESVSRSERYLTKVLPIHQRIHMPKPAEYLLTELEIKNQEEWNLNIIPGTLVKNAIPEIIYKKTGFLFYNTDKKTNYIIPRNLRNLLQLLNLLVQMPDYDSIDDLKQKKFNRETFCNYFYNDWCDINIDLSYRKYINRIRSTTQLNEVNLQVIHILKIISPLVDIYKGEKNITYILDNKNFGFNISLGDVFSIIHLIEKLTPGEPIKKFLFFIKTYYSFLLHQYDYEDDKLKQNQAPNSTDFLLKTVGGEARGNTYEAIGGGSLFNVPVEHLIYSSDKGSLFHRAVKLENIINLFDTCNKNLEEKKKSDELILLTTFVVLCTSYATNNKHLVRVDEKNYRKNIYPYYNDKISSSSDKIVLDIGSFFFNLNRIDKCFERFDEIESAKKFITNSSSLITELLKIKGEGNSENEKNTELKKGITHSSQTYNLIESPIFLTNTEIIENFFMTIIGNEVEEEDYDDLFQAYHNLLNAVCSYKIPIYERDIKGRIQKIDFRSLDPFKQIFSSTKKSTKRAFIKIMSNTELASDFGIDIDDEEETDNDRNSQTTKPDQGPIGASAAQR